MLHMEWRCVSIRWMKQNTALSPSAVESIIPAIRAVGARVTPARIHVLGLLQAAYGPLSHSEIEENLLTNTALRIDRVTLYRVLDWLTETGLAHKATDAQGVFHFSAAQPNVEHARHTHFRCFACGGVFCLDAPPPKPPILPQGFRLASVKLDISGECPKCVSHTA